ncbi:MAG TPA: Hsp20/alpha crystallin family protein [Spirochaetia bacterium]|nr:Hsp20/alpha crystallin family protein [Spirochaetia bacterium]
MAFDLVPSRLFPFSSLRVPSVWSDEDDWLTTASPASGLSVSEDDKNVYVEASVPGIDPKDVEITFQDGYLWIRGESSEEVKDKTRKYYRESSKSFSYRVAVPGEIDEKVEPEATSKNGVMTITFTKAPKVQPKKIQIKVK